MFHLLLHNNFSSIFYCLNAIKRLPPKMGFGGSDVHILALVIHILVIIKRLFLVEPCGKHHLQHKLEVHKFKEIISWCLGGQKLKLENLVGLKPI